jgi:hypothetical protein
MFSPNNSPWHFAWGWESSNNRSRVLPVRPAARMKNRTGLFGLGVGFSIGNSQDKKFNPRPQNIPVRF